MGVCCVDGCHDLQKGIVYFEFPTRKSLRRKWLDVLNIGSKVPLGTVVCSQHFNSDEYEVVRGKVRLKSKVVPTLLLQNKSEDVKNTEETSLESETVRENSELLDDKMLENSVSPDEKIVESSVLPVEKMLENSITPDKETVGNSVIPDKETVENSSILDKETVENSVIPDKETVENSSVLDKETVGNSVIPDKETVENSSIPDKEPVGNSVIPDKERVENSLIPEKETVGNSVIPEKETVENSSIPNKETVGNSVILEKETVENSAIPDKEMVENSETPQPDSTTGNTFEPTKNSRKERRRELKEKRKRERKSSVICKVVVKDSTDSSNSSVDRDILPDPRQQPDFEDMITNYQIKNSKPNSLLPQEMEIGYPRGGEADDAIVVDDQGDAPPVFIEIAVDKDNNTNEAGNEDCLIVLESVQVDIDPSSLMLPERDSDEENACDLVEEEKAPDKNQDPVSLLTSSDEDDVILEEPHIDTVEVSDETDEDDMPLVKLVKKRSSKEKSATKKQKKADSSLKKLFWKRMYDFYCIQCNFTTMDSLTYHNHLKEHQKVIQVCSTCSYTTASKSQFTKHLRKHGKKYKCHLCDHVASHNVSLVYHLQTHKLGDSYIEKVRNGSKCKKCGFFSKYRKVVLNHVRACGSNAKMYPCDQCAHIAVKKDELKSHWRRKHKGSVVEVYSDSSYE